MLVRRLLELQQEISTVGARPSEPRDRPAERWRGRLARFALITAISVIGAAGPSAAEPQPWNGTLEFEFAGRGMTAAFQGSGVATVNSSGGGDHLSTLRLAGGISGASILPVTDPEATAEVKSIRFESVRLGTGTFVKDRHESVDLISGVTGYTVPDYNFNFWTRAIEVTVLGATDREVTSMTLRTLDTSEEAFVIASIYTSGGAIVAEGTTVVGAGSQPPITIPISATLTAGATYYFAFFSSAGMADVFVPDSQPYIETSGTFMVNGAYYVPDYAFPTLPTAVFPMIEVAIASHSPTGAAVIPVRGIMRTCLFVVGCYTNLPLDMTANDGNTGFGVGGLMTAGKFRGVRISIEAAPWTLGTVTAINQTSPGQNFVMVSRAGFVHGAASASGSSTAADSGVIQLVAPQQVSTFGIKGNSSEIALFSVLTLHFIPEPELLLLLGSGVVVLALIGGRRMQR